MCCCNVNICIILFIIQVSLNNILYSMIIIVEIINYIASCSMYHIILIYHILIGIIIHIILLLNNNTYHYVMN